jgi:hypothetical protein
MRTRHAVVIGTDLSRKDYSLQNYNNFSCFLSMGVIVLSLAKLKKIDKAHNAV